MANNEQINKVKELSSLQDKQLNDSTIRLQLNNALKTEEFEIHYQPYFGIQKKEMGMEALIRWDHPDLGLLPPDSFLEVAETTDLIIEIEKWVLKQSIYEATKLREQGLKDLRLSINISAKQFENERFPNMVGDILKYHSFQPSHLTLEITERFLIKPSNIGIMNEIKDYGIRISIDDFGTSYSSLQYLKDFPIDELKIDRSFISDLDTDLNNRKIVEMIIILGHHLNLTIVGEGVETKTQYQLLKKMKCDRVQGFLFSKPLPLKKFAQKYE